MIIGKVAGAPFSLVIIEARAFMLDPEGVDAWDKTPRWQQQ